MGKKYSKPESFTTRAFNYALFLTPFQEQIMLEEQVKLRKVWNALVFHSEQVFREWKHGNRGGMVVELKRILNAKGIAGRASEAFNKIAEERGISFDAAKSVKRKEMLAEYVDIVVSKKGHKLIRISKTKLASAYAKEYVSSIRESFGLRKPTAFWAVIRKFNDCCKRVIKGDFGRLHFKRFTDSVSQQSQIEGASNFQIGPVTDLNKLIGHQCFKNCNVTFHRPLPVGAVVKQIAVSGREGKWVLTVQFDCPRSSVEKKFDSTGEKVGIDPGIKTAFTLSNGKEITPKSQRHDVLRARYEKLSSKLDRQTRANNPECFNSNGTWKKGKRRYHFSSQMKETVLAMKKIQEYFSDFRKDFYNKAAHDLLSRFDEIYIGNWKPDRTRKVGKGKKGRAINRKLGEHALSTFKSILKDKANLSATSKTVEEVNEAYTTCTCPFCHEKTGPSGEKDLDIREWICSNCDMTVKRDMGAALNTLYFGISLKKEKDRKDTPIPGCKTKMASALTES